jgi:hypothetical protein
MKIVDSAGRDVLEFGEEEGIVYQYRVRFPLLAEVTVNEVRGSLYKLVPKRPRFVRITYAVNSEREAKFQTAFDHLLDLGDETGDPPKN